MSALPENLESLWSASTQRGQLFYVAELFGKRQFVALNPPVACRHLEPHEVIEAYGREDVHRATSVWGKEPEYLYAPSPGTLAPIMTKSNSEVMIYNVETCRPEPAKHPLPEPTWILYTGDGIDYWLPYRHRRILLNEFL